MREVVGLVFSHYTGGALLVVFGLVIALYAWVDSTDWETGQASAPSIWFVVVVMVFIGIGLLAIFAW